MKYTAQQAVSVCPAWGSMKMRFSNIINKIIGFNSDRLTLCSTLFKDKLLAVWVMEAFASLITSVTILPGFRVFFLCLWFPVFSSLP